VRLLFVSPHYGAVGGIRFVIDACADAALRAAHSVAGILDADVEQFPGPARALRLYPFPERASDLRRLRRFGRRFPVAGVRLLAAVRRFAPDVVNVHCVRRFAPYAALLRRVTRVPQIVTLHEAALPPAFAQNRGLFQLLVRSGHLVVACSEDVARYARQVGGAPPVAVVPNGYDPEEFAAGRAYAHPRRYVLGVGRLEPQKGFDVLIDAVARLGHPDLDVLIAGEGSRRETLEALARERGLASRIRFLGLVDRATCVALLRSAAVVACPSRFEGMPLLCIEALAAGRPIVASAVNGVPEIVRDGDTGVLVAPEDPVALAQALARILGSPAEAERLGQRGREWVGTHHTWSVVTRRFLDLCSELVPARAAPAVG